MRPHCVHTEHVDAEEDVAEVDWEGMFCEPRACTPVVGSWLRGTRKMLTGVPTTSAARWHALSIAHRK